MPQASDEDRARYRQMFGTIDARPGIQYLEKRGWTLLPDYNWRSRPADEITKEDMFVCNFLFHEWDFGGPVWSVGPYVSTEGWPMRSLGYKNGREWVELTVPKSVVPSTAENMRYLQTIAEQNGFDGVRAGEDGDNYWIQGPKRDEEE